MKRMRRFEVGKRERSDNGWSGCCRLRSDGGGVSSCLFVGIDGKGLLESLG
jgi:hypothetical protein